MVDKLPEAPTGCWHVTSSNISFQDRWLTVRSDSCVTPSGAVIAPWHVLEYSDWVNVVALDRDGRMLLVRQYRHGCGEVLLGLPSGACEAWDGLEASERALSAAVRELAEETGYRAHQLTPVFCGYPNAASHSNMVTSFLATEIEFAGGSIDDPYEPIEIVLEDIATVIENVISGAWVWQSMHVAALWSAIGWVLSHPEMTGISDVVRRRIMAAVGVVS